MPAVPPPRRDLLSPLVVLTPVLTLLVLTTAVIAVGLGTGALAAALATALVATGVRPALGRLPRPRPGGVPLAPGDPLGAVVAEELRATGTRAPHAVHVTLEHEVRVVRTGRRRVLELGLTALTAQRDGVIRAEIALALLRDADRVGAAVDRLRERAVRLAEDTGPWARAAAAAEPLLARAALRREAVILTATARRLGREAAFGVLRGAVRTGAFARFWEDDVVPCLAEGYLPPVLEGWQRFITTPAVAEHAGAAIAEAFATSLAPLVAALDAVPDPTHAPAPIPGADRGRQERAILDTTLPARQLVDLPWARAGEVVALAALRRRLPDAWLGTVAELAELVERHESDPEQLGAALAVALHDAGWVIEQLPGTPLSAHHDDLTILPLIVPFVLTDPAARAGWRETVAAHGLGALGLPARGRGADVGGW